MNNLIYYVIAFNAHDDLSSGINSMLTYQIEKGELKISPHVRLSGHNKGACIDSRELAESYKKACIPIFRKRYGYCSEEDLVVHECSASNYKKLEQIIIDDSKMIRARLAQGVMAPNKRPVLE